jgi:membrane protease YdiL (CAAX protease family)
MLLVLLVGSGLAGDAAGVGEQWSQVAAAVWYVGWGAWTARLCRHHSIRIRHLFKAPRKPFVWVNVAMALPLLLLSFGLVWLQVALGSLVAPQFVQGWLTGDAGGGPGSAPFVSALALLATVGLAPIVEEMVFRGVLLRSWSHRWGRTKALIGTAAIFAVLHPGDLVGSFVFGVVLGVIRLRTTTLVVSIACHALHNALAELLASDAVIGPGSGEGPILTVAKLQSLWWAGALCIAIGGGCIWVFLRRNLPPRHTRL